jgi:hypothetical protein
MEGSSRPLLVSRGAAAASLGISLRTFETKVERNVRTVRIGRAVRVLAADLERLVADRAR